MSAWRALLVALALACISGCATTSLHSTPGDALSMLPALKGDHFALRPGAIGRDFHIFVRLPEGYDARAAKRYPVVYLLDGDSLFPLLAPTHLFLHYDEHIPEAIIVGIAYGAFGPANFRATDYTARYDDSPPEHGGAPQFLRFLQEQLLPAVESRHAVDPSRRILLGQSTGGTFVLWSAQQAPDLFWARIASNPGAAVGKPVFSAAANAARRSDLRIIIASSSRDTQARRDAARAWTNAWQSRTNIPWRVELMPVEGTHAATIGEIYRRALLDLFADEVQAARRAQP